MSLVKKIVAIAVVVAVVGGGVALMVMDIPAPSSKVTKTLDNDRFPN